MNSPLKEKTKIKMKLETTLELTDKEESIFLKKELMKLANNVRKKVLKQIGTNRRMILRREDGGDPHFMLDEVAESAVEESLKKSKLPTAYFSEDRGFISFCKNPKWMLIIDPIDGTRPAIADFESCCFSAAAVPYSSRPKFGEIKSAIIMEMKTGNYFYADTNQTKIHSTMPGLPLLTQKTNPEYMFWSTELTAHPINQIAKVCGTLIDNSVTLGAVFVFTSSTYSLTRIITGQLDAHVDVGNRIVRDYPETEEEFKKVGRGKVVTLYPYDIAAAAFILVKSGGIVTDAYGNSLDNLSLLTDKSMKEQCSIIAASNINLHKKITSQLTWPRRGSQ